MTKPFKVPRTSTIVNPSVLYTYSHFCSHDGFSSLNIPSNNSALADLPNNTQSVIHRDTTLASLMEHPHMFKAVIGEATTQCLCALHHLDSHRRERDKRQLLNHHYYASSHIFHTTDLSQAVRGHRLSHVKCACQVLTDRMECPICRITHPVQRKVEQPQRSIRVKIKGS